MAEVFNYAPFKVVEGQDTSAGPVSTILAGVHGNERQGVRVVRDLVHTLQIPNGRVYLAFGNPEAIAIGQRKLESDLNRAFKPPHLLTDLQRASYEHGRAQELKTIFDASEVLLDIHGTRNPHGVPFIICEPNAHAIAAHLPVDEVVGGFDYLEPGGTDYYMNWKGGVGICFEAGYNENDQSGELAREAVEQFLIARGHTDQATTLRKQRHSRVFYQYWTIKDFSREGREFPDFTLVRKGEILGKDSGNPEPVTAPEDSLTLFLHHDSDQANDDAMTLARVTSKPEDTNNVLLGTLVN